MAVSLNGWPGIVDASDPRLATGIVPGTNRRVTLAKFCLPLFLHYIATWDAELPRLSVTNPANELDGWEYRDARSGRGLSNHASGTAVDIAYRILLADRGTHMTPAERETLAGILAHYTTADGHHVLANGYVWAEGKDRDEMHTELSQAWDTANGALRYTTPHDVIEVIGRLGIRPDGTTKPKPSAPAMEGNPMLIRRSSNGWVTLLANGKHVGVSGDSYPHYKGVLPEVTLDDAAFNRLVAQFPLTGPSI